MSFLKLNYQQLNQSSNFPQHFSVHLSSTHIRIDQKSEKIKPYIYNPTLLSFAQQQQQQITMDNYPTLINNQWIPSHRNQQFVLINTYTKEEYSSHVLSKCHPIIKDYQRRQVLMIPHIPKVVLLQCQAQLYQNEVLLLIQNGQYQLTKLVQDYTANSKNILDILYNIIKTASLLYKKYGTFKFTENMLKVSKGPEILLWIHENYYANSPQYPILKENVRDMVFSLLEVLGEKMPMVRLIKQLRSGAKLFEDFDCVIQHVLNQQARRRKLSLTPTKIITQPFQNSRIKRHINPCKSPPMATTRTNPRKHRQSYDSKSTRSDTESLINSETQNKRWIQIPDVNLEQMGRGVFLSVIMADEFYYYWNDELADELRKILNN